MQSLIIVGKDIEKLKEKAKEICKENKISDFDIDILQTGKQIGIGDIRTLQEKIFLKPFKGDKKAVILEAFYGATLDAQNSFLKILEEPPLTTIIIILVTSLDFILPTILSRCNLINLERLMKLSKDEMEVYAKILSELEKNNPSQSLVLAQDYGKTKEEALIFLEGLIIALEKNLNLQNAKILKKLQIGYNIIKQTNVSPRFALENLFLNI